MNTIINPNKSEWKTLSQRPTKSLIAIEDTTMRIFKEVRQKGDATIVKYTSFFDGIIMNDFSVSETEIKEAIAKVPQDLKTAIQTAKSNIETFHRAQLSQPIKIDTMEGVTCWQEKRPIQKIGLYIPGGSAPLFSTVLMLAVPAQIAGCKEIVLCSPPDNDGKINPAILFAAYLCGITQIRKVGGIQAIAGMTFGTKSIPKVYKIFGPGNQFVTVAKQVATRFGVAIDMPAGPSELLVVADDTAKVEFVASDLLSQAEHGDDSQVVLVSTSIKFLSEVAKEVNKQLQKLPRKEIAAKAIQNSKLIYLKDDQVALDFINKYAPEHFIIAVENEQFYIDGIENAGSVFIGNYTPESAGDYASGTNHTLPTNGYAKNYSGVNLDSFLKSMTFQKISEKGIQNIGKTIEIMAAAEGLQAHKNAVTLRLNELNKNENEVREINTNQY